MKVADRLREVVKEVRRRPYLISDLIPLLCEAADELDDREQEKDAREKDPIGIRTESTEL